MMTPLCLALLVLRYVHIAFPLKMASAQTVLLEHLSKVILVPAILIISLIQESARPVTPSVTAALAQPTQTVLPVRWVSSQLMAPLEPA